MLFPDKSGADGAYLNVMINAASITDENVVVDLKSRAASLLEQSEAKEKELLAKVEAIVAKQ